jgi:hypothetical protein
LYRSRYDFVTLFSVPVKKLSSLKPGDVYVARAENAAEFFTP